MELSLEIPTPHIEEFLPLTDLPFGLAQLTFKDPAYRWKMQGCLLDNGMYELGEPLPVDKLVAAAESGIAPVAVIALDWEDDYDKTLQAAYDFLKASKDRPWTVGALVQGKDLEERMECFYALRSMHYRPIGFPFRSPREETIERLRLEGMFDENAWYHLFGLRNNNELKWKLPGRWTLDTGKPFKGFRMDKEPIRGHGRLDLQKQLDPDKRFVALWNIAWMRKEMR